MKLKGKARATFSPVMLRVREVQRSDTIWNFTLKLLAKSVPLQLELKHAQRVLLLLSFLFLR